MKTYANIYYRARMQAAQREPLHASRERTASEIFVSCEALADYETGRTVPPCDVVQKIGKTGNPFTFRVMNERLAFYMNDSEVAYLSNNKLYVTQAEILTRLQIGKFAFEPQTNGNMSIVYTG